jgi:hypothetical protein
VLLKVQLQQEVAHPQQAVDAFIWHFWAKVSWQVWEWVKRVVVPVSTNSSRAAM